MENDDIRGGKSTHILHLCRSTDTKKDFGKSRSTASTYLLSRSKSEKVKVLKYTV